MRTQLFQLLLVMTILCVASCKKLNEEPDEKQVSTLLDCFEPNDTLIIENRTFSMGFSTWPFGSSPQAKQETYASIAEFSDIYSEQFDDHIPWFGLRDGRPLPQQASSDLNTRVNNIISSNDLVLSVSLFNPERNDLITGYNGQTPTYGSISDQEIEDTYFKYITIMADEFPNLKYLVVAMEVNEFYLKSPEKWDDYKTLMSNLKPRLYERYPGVLISESITLHNLSTSSNQQYVDNIISYVNELDFVAISYYPFLHGALEDNQIQDDFDFLHDKITKPIAIVETGQIAETLEVPEVTLEADECTQKDYVQLLLSNANSHDYEFVIWWTHKDYDELYETFPDDVKALGRIWRDAGLINEADQNRPGFREWEAVFNN
ncbi:arabinogalactan endo-1,4-beta-galactosidase [Marinoscillum pacificum]|uniref:arabinogalactan endo-1,4-beta-galactosidase n=1 Tax=Marinoscillum pacificum TaxID=392723 RepID=UPI0021587424|nr:arabinogalactan endo-1,4-beta-galactosidase [Marinoscillum pacificum]